MPRSSTFLPGQRWRSDDGVVTLGNLSGGLKNDGELRRKTAERLIQTYGLKDVVFAKPVKAKKDHINTFYNLDHQVRFQLLVRDSSSWS